MKRKGGYAHCLSEDLDAVPADVRTSLEKLVSPSAPVRLEGLGDVPALTGRVEAIPHLLSLATHPAYPQASALLVRVSATLAQADSPPRSRPAHAMPLFDALARRSSVLMRVARTSRDPESARAAARILGHLEDHDAELAPLLLALLSGAADATERAPLLYFLARIQLARGAELHPRVMRARQAPARDPERVAVLLAFEDAGEADSVTTEELAQLRSDTASLRLPDPRVWGRTL